MVTEFWLERRKGRDHSEDVNVDAEISLKMDRREMGFGGVEWIHMAEIGTGCVLFLSAVMNLWAP